MPRVYLSGYAGSSVVGQGDVLQPLMVRNARNLFAYFQGQYGYADEDWAKNPWSGSFGIGYRQIANNAAVLGAYVLSDYNRTTTNHSIWLISPGIEALGRVWEFRANGYFPISKHDWSTSGWADEYGNYNYINYSGHDQYDAKLTFNEETGPGADAELGRTLFKIKNTVVTGLINGYYFHMRDNDDVRGGGASIEVRPNTYMKLSLDGSYDNYAHAEVMLGVQVSLYDLFSNGSKVLNEQNLQRRLFEPLQRNFATLASGSDVRMTGGPRDQENRKNPTPTVSDEGSIERSNIWFFNGSNPLPAAGNVGGDVADGTYEHPYTRADFNQGKVKYIYDYTMANGDTNAYLYFSPGTYDAYNGTRHLEIFPGESLWGKMGGDKAFQEPATGANRSIFSGGLQLDSNTSINNLLLQNNSSVNFDTGIIMDGATHVGINDSQIVLMLPVTLAIILAYQWKMILR